MWFFYSILAAILWGLDYSLTEKVAKKIHFSTLLTVELFVGFLAMLTLTVLTGSWKGDWTTITTSKQTLFLGVLIVICFNIANVLIILSITNRNATLAGLIEISYPLFTALSSWVLFKHVDVNPWTSLGGALVLAGVGIIYMFNR